MLKDRIEKLIKETGYIVPLKDLCNDEKFPSQRESIIAIDDYLVRHILNTILTWDIKKKKFLKRKLSHMRIQ